MFACVRVCACMRACMQAGFGACMCKSATCSHVHMTLRSLSRLEGVK